MGVDNPAQRTIRSSWNLGACGAKAERSLWMKFTGEFVGTTAGATGAAAADGLLWPGSG